MLQITVENNGALNVEFRVTSKAQAEHCMELADSLVKTHFKENGEFCQLVLVNHGGLKLQCVKSVKETLNLGLKEAKDFVDASEKYDDTVIYTGCRTKCEQYMEAIKQCGAICKIV